MSFLPSRPLAPYSPYSELRDGDPKNANLHAIDSRTQILGEDVEQDIADFSSTRYYEPPRGENNYNAFATIKSFGANINPFSKKASSPGYFSIELGNITHISSSNPRSSGGQPQKPSDSKGWRKGILYASATAAFVLLLNILFLAISYGKYGATDGVGTLYQGNCGRAAHMDSGMHVVINIMSTILLGASNYVMQILGAPTRAQVQNAHQKRTSLFIGVPNLRNLKWVGWKRLVLWFFLGLSALPLHLFWNSAVFSTLQANQYDILVVSNEFVESDTFDCNIENVNRTTGMGGFDTSDFCKFAGGLYNQFKNGTLDRLENVDCMKAYSVDFLQGRRNLLAVSNQTSVSRAVGTDLVNGSIFDLMDSTTWQNSMLTIGGSGWMANQWLCSSPQNNYSHTFFSAEAQTEVTVCDTSLAIADAKNLKLGPNSVPIDYFLSEPVPEVCDLQYISQVMIIVIVCNAVKLACIILAMYALSDRPLVIVGDAIESFLDVPDESTKGECLAVVHSKHSNHHTSERIKSGMWSIKEYQLSPDGISRIWSHNQNRWFAAPKVSNWLICIILCFIFLAIAGVLLHVGIVSLLGTSFSSLGFSSISPSTLITWFSTSTSLDVTSTKQSILLLLIIITNSPQLLFSLLYFMYNAIYTAMLSTYEISRYATHRRALRISYPTGIQRSTYWLQLPFRYSIPLLVSSSFLHWLISQSLFIARISTLDALGNPSLVVLSDFQGLAESNLLTLPGYSPKALIVAIVVGVFMLLALIRTGLRKYGYGMPLGGNDSWAISAACHASGADDMTGKGRLAWGVLGPQSEDGIGHCCFTDLEVEPPVVGEKYA